MIFSLFALNYWIDLNKIHYTGSFSPGEGHKTLFIPREAPG